MASASGEEASLFVCAFRKAKWDFTVSPWTDEEIESFDGVFDIIFSYLDDSSGEWKDSWSTDETKRMTSGLRYHGLLPRCVKFVVSARGGIAKPVSVTLESAVNLPAYEK